MSDRCTHAISIDRGKPGACWGMLRKAFTLHIVLSIADWLMKSVLCCHAVKTSFRFSFQWFYAKRCFVAESTAYESYYTGENFPPVSRAIAGILQATRSLARITKSRRTGKYSLHWLQLAKVSRLFVAGNRMVVEHRWRSIIPKSGAEHLSTALFGQFVKQNCSFCGGGSFKVSALINQLPAKIVCLPHRLSFDEKLCKTKKLVNKIQLFSYLMFTKTPKLVSSFQTPFYCFLVSERQFFVQKLFIPALSAAWRLWRVKSGLSSNTVKFYRILKFSNGDVRSFWFFYYKATFLKKDF